jgi:superfamily II DNA helicase RecQ
LEAYYQESGRAGRDGGPANCMLYYSPKDVSRMLSMVHGQGSERAFWSMVRYGQEHGDDATCREVILATLGEPVEKASRQSIGNVEVKDVTKHAKIVIRLLDWSVKSLTIQQLVQLWRGKEAPALYVSFFRFSITCLLIMLIMNWFVMLFLILV